MFSQPQAQHQWLHRLIGQWSFEGACSVGDDKPPMQSSGKEIVRSLGGLWTIGEGESSMPDGDVGRSIMTLGYDPKRGRFVGSFVASMMDHFWKYDGILDATGSKLDLHTEGPDFTGASTELIPYIDTIEFISDDHRTLTSKVRLADGTWKQIMEGHYRRLK